MDRKLIVAAAAAAGLAGIVGVSALAQDADPKPPADLTFLGASLTEATLEQGKAVYAENCAACHGADREGQPDWRRRNDDGRMPAPPHDDDGHSWHHADRDLFTITKLGLGAVVPGYESDMPAFEDTLSDAEITAVLGYIKSRWSDRARGYQAEITAADEGGS